MVQAEAADDICDHAMPVVLVRGKGGRGLQSCGPNEVCEALPNFVSEGAPISVQSS